MSFQDLIIEIEKSNQQELNQATEEHSKEIDSINREFEEKIREIKESLALRLDKEKQEIILRRKEEEEFLLKMNLLLYKKELIEKALEKATKEILDLSSKEKKEIIKRKVLASKNLFTDKSKIYVPVGNIAKIKQFLHETGIKNITIKEKQEIKEGFILEDDKIIIDFSLISIITNLVKENYSRLVNILFS